MAMRHSSPPGLHYRPRVWPAYRPPLTPWPRSNRQRHKWAGRPLRYSGPLSKVTNQFWTRFRFRFRYVLHPFAAKYSHWMWHSAIACSISHVIAVPGPLLMMMIVTTWLPWYQFPARHLAPAYPPGGHRGCHRERKLSPQSNRHVHSGHPTGRTGSPSADITRLSTSLHAHSAAARDKP
jgi:hypothetical protein